MGVTYKLTEDVVSFILDQKQKSTDLSCRELVDLVAQQFNRLVSKSSVHEVLKEANITSQRGRKFKNKFQIPDDKKAQLIANLPPAIAQTLPTPPVETPLMTSVSEPIIPITETPTEELIEPQEEPLRLMPDPVMASMPTVTETSKEESKPIITDLPALEESNQTIDIKDFFIQAAFYDLFPKSGGSVRSKQDIEAMSDEVKKKEIAYRSLSVACFKIELQDESVFYIDARNHRVEREFCKPLRKAPIESAMIRMADTLLNNIKPLIIRQAEGEFLDAAAADFLKAMDKRSEKQISRIILLDEDQEEIIDFAPIVNMKRNFIMGININNKDISGLIQGPLTPTDYVSTYVISNPTRSVSQEIFLAGNLYRGIVILSDTNNPVVALITNMDPKIPDHKIVFDYMQTFSFESFTQLSEASFTQTGDFLLQHAQYLFGPTALEANDMPLKAKGQFNAAINVVNISIPDNYEKKAYFTQACNVLNNLDITDENGRKIWAKIA